MKHLRGYGKRYFSLAIIAAIGAIVVGATTAYFSDTETSTGNTFTAGNLDLKIDSTCHYDGMICSDGYWVEEEPESSAYPELLQTPCSCTWEAKDLNGDRFFDYGDIKPGDWGENTISVHVDNNDAYGKMIVTAIENRENGCTEPEVASEAGTPYPCTGQWCGELAQNTEVRVWIDNGLNAQGEPVGVAGDNIYQTGEVLLTSGTDGWRTLFANAYNLCNLSDGAATYPASDFASTSDYTAEVPLGLLTGGETYFYGVEWRVPGSVNNIIQGDSMKANISFEIEQARHNTTPFIN